jgi:AraC-like DNA-binding protein
VSAGTAAVRPLGRLIEVGVAAGVGRELLMNAAGVTDADLRDPDARVPVAAEIAVWQVLAKKVSDPGFGVRVGASWSIRHSGLLGYLMCFSATLRDALRRVERYGRIFTEAVEFKLEEGRPDVAFAFCHPTLGPGQPFAQDARLAAVLRASREITGINIVPLEVTFTYAQPSGTLAHREHFQCPVRFGARTAHMILRASDLELPSVRVDETLAHYLSKHAEHVLASLVQGETTQHAARAAVWSMLADGKPSLERVAVALRVPPRTLQRRLAAEGTSLHGEIEEIRRTMAIAALRNRSVGISDVAFALGYAEPSTFFRSFKRWTGTTPHRFRSAA